MFDLYQIILVVKIAELSEVTESDIQNVLKEKVVFSGKELYPILCNQPMAIVVEATDSKLEEYSKDIISKVEKVVGQVYDTITKQIVVDYFVLNSKRSLESIDKIISRSKNIINKYTELQEGSLGWFLVESVKRQLMSVYTQNPSYLVELKKLIVEVQKTEEAYTICANNTR